MDTGALNTADLVVRIRGGDQEAFAELVERYRDAACAVAYTYLGSFDDVQDAVQEVFVHAYTHLDQLRDPAKFGPWLRRITANTCLSRLRKQKNELFSLEEIEEPASVTADSEKLAMRIIVRNALSSLSEDMRLTVTLSYINGYSHSEVADFLEIPLDTVRSRLKHAKRKLREEMIEMVEDVLHEDKPNEQLVKRILAAARLVRKALMIGTNEEEIRRLQRCDEALAAIRKFNSSTLPEQTKALILNFIETEWHFENAQEKARVIEELKNKNVEDIQLRVDAEILATKGDALLRLGDLEEAKALFQQAIELVNSRNYPELRFEITNRIAHICYHNIHLQDLAPDFMRKAVEAAGEVGDTFSEAMNLWALANIYFFEGEVAEAKQLFDRSYTLFKESNSPDRAAMSHSMAALIEEVGEERALELLRWSASCLVIQKTDGVTEMTDEGGGWRTIPTSGLWALDASLLWQFNAISKKVANRSVRPGKSWTNPKEHHSPGAVKEVISVVSYDDQISVPAGDFTGCLLLEMITTEDRLPKGLSEERKQWMRSYVCGTRRAWFAPGVGLVQFVIRNNAGEEAIIQLSDYKMTQPSSEYIPLAIGNSWTYNWVNIPAEYTAGNVCKVVSNQGDMWYLENYEYAYKD